MMKTIRQIFKIYEDEGYKVALFSITGTLLFAGVAIGNVAADSLFIARVGASHYPTIYMILPFVMLAVTPLIAFITKKFGVYRLQLIMLASLIVFGLLIRGILVLPFGNEYNLLYLYYAIKLYANVWFIVSFTAFWNFADAYFDIISAKRLFAVLSGASSLGTMLGSSLVLLATQMNINSSELFSIWSFLAVLNIIPVVKIRYHFRQTEEEIDQTLTPIKQWREFFNTQLGSNYVRLLMLIAFFIMFISHFCEFQYMVIFDDWSDDVSSLAGLFGNLYFSVSIFNALVTFFVYNRLVIWLGVRNVALVQPSVYLLTFLFFVIFIDSTYYLFGVAVFAFFTYQGVQAAVEYNNWNLVLNALPQNQKYSIRTFIEGMIDPLGGALAGGTLLILDRHFEFPSIHVALISLGLAAIYLILILFLRPLYLKSMIHNLRMEWLDFFQSDQNVLGKLSPQVLHNLTRAPLTKDTVKTVCSILWLNNRRLSVDTMFQYLEHKPPSEWQPVREFVEKRNLMQDEDVSFSIKNKVLGYSKQFRNTILNQLHWHQIFPLFDRASDDTFFAHTTHLWKQGDLRDIKKIVSNSLEKLEGTDEDKQWALSVIQQTNHQPFCKTVVRYLNDPNSQVRQAALNCLCQLTGPGASALIPYLIENLHQGSSEQNVQILIALRKIGDSNCLAPLLQKAESFSPNELRQISQLLIEIGTRSLPTCVEVVQNPEYPYAGRSLAARTISKIALPQLQSMCKELLYREIEAGYKSLYFQHQIQYHAHHSSGLRVLAKYYKDRYNSSFEFIINVLALAGQLPNYESLIAALRSNSPKMKGNAIETLEQAVSQSIFKKILPVFDGRSGSQQIEFFQKHFSAEVWSIPQIVERAQNSRIDLERAAAIQAYWDMNQKISINQLQRGVNKVQEGNSHEKRYLQTNHWISKKTILTLMEQNNSGISQDSPIEIIDVCIRSIVFSHLAINDLILLLHHVSTIELNEGEKLSGFDPQNPCVHVVKRGLMYSLDNEEDQRHEGESIGESCLVDTHPMVSDFVAKTPARLYKFQKADILQQANRNSHLARMLLEAKIAGIFSNGKTT